MTQNKDLSNVLIVSDFDGTLRGSFGEIPQRNIDAIEHFKSLGGIFIVASGRAGFVLDAVEPKIKNLVNGKCVYSNGSYMYDYQTAMRSNEKYVSDEIIKEMLCLIRDMYSASGIRIVRGDEYLTPDRNSEIERQIRLGYMNNVVVYDFDTVPTDLINKITVCADESVILDIKKAVEDRYDLYVDVLLSAKNLIDIQPKNVSKGGAVEEIKKEFQSVGKDVKVYAVGDYENDLDMLRKADYACCPSNSLESVLEFCPIHLCSNDEGAIADLIEKIEQGIV